MAKLTKTTPDESESGNLISWSERICDNCHPFLRQLLLTLIAMALAATGHAGAMDKAAIPAFPGAEGAGAFTPGGRGGKVFEVTNLNDNGPGSLREALEAQGPRIVIFRISGIITLEKLLTISNPYVTVAWQTAPGDGICIRGQTTEINTHDVVLRYLRFRRGNIKDRNNVLFNWRHRTVDGGDASSMVNIVGNYYKPGPAVNEGASRYRICRPQHLDMHSEAQRDGKWYVAENFVAGNPRVTSDNWAGGVQFDDVEAEEEIRALMKKVRATAPAPAPHVTQQSAKKAYALVLAQAGATLPKRDPVDKRIIKIVRTGKPTYKNGIIDIPSDVGGWPQYETAPAPADSDHDGMPDAWEKRFGLNSNDPSDGPKDADNDGYTNVEEWLNRTDPTQFVDYRIGENNRSSLR